MRFYVVKLVSEVTQAQLNMSGAKRITNTRMSVDRTRCIIEFDDEVGAYFASDIWYTHEEVLEVVRSSDWNPDIPAPTPPVRQSLVEKMKNLVGLA